jgi:hypothetical protein
MESADPQDIVPISNRLNEVAKTPEVNTKNDPEAILNVSLFATAPVTIGSKVMVIVPVETPGIEMAVIVLLRPMFAAVPDRNSIVLPTTYPFMLCVEARTVTVEVEPPVAV